MIDLYYWPTPNGHKITIFLEETGLEYKIVPVNIRKGEQFAPEFLKFSPNNRMPAIIDHEGPGGKPLALFESGAILLYLAEKTGKFMPSEMRARYNVVQWLMFQMAGVGPMFGQRGHFLRAAPEKIPYAIDRYTNESRRLLNVIENRLAESAVPGGRLLDRGHGDLSVGSRNAPRTRAIGEPPQLQAMARRNRRSSRRKTRRRRNGRPCRPNRSTTKPAQSCTAAKQFERR